MKTKICFIIILVCIGITPSYSQRKVLDSLVLLLKTDKPDSLKFSHLYNISGQYLNTGDLDSALLYSEKALALAEKLRFKDGISKASSVMAGVYFFKGDYAKTLENMNRSLKIDKELGLKDEYCSDLGNIGSVYLQMADYPAALDCYLRSLKTVEELGDKRLIASNYGNIGTVYQYLGENEKALDYYLQSLKMDEELANQTEIGNDLCNLGVIYDRMKQYSTSLHYAFLALQKDSIAGNREGTALCLLNIGSYFKSQGDSAMNAGNSIYATKEKYTKALEYLQRSKKMNGELDNKKTLSITLLNMGSIFKVQKKYRDAYDYSHKALMISDSIGSLDDEKLFYLELSELYEVSDIPLPDSTGGKLLNMEQMRLQSKYFYQDFIRVRDNIFSEDNKKQLMRKELNFEFEKKAVVAKAEHDKELAVAEADKKRQLLFLWLIGAIALAAGIIAVVIFRSLRITRNQKKIIEVQKDAVEMQKSLIEEKQKEILDSINYAKRIQQALMPTEKFIDKNLKRMNSKKE